MIFDAVEVCGQVALTYFEADLATLVTARSLMPVTGWKIITWQDAEKAIELGSAVPLLGITLGPNASTQAKSQGKRESLSAVLFDAYLEGEDATVVAQIMALVPEAVMMIADRLAAGVGGGVFGAAVTELSTQVDVTGAYEERGDQPLYWQRARTVVPVWDQDTGL